MPETDIRTLLKLETEKRGIDEAKRQLKEIVKQQENLKAAFISGDKTAEQFTAELSKLAKQEQTVQKAIASVTDAIDEQSDSFSKNISAVERRQQEFDKVSQSVAGAGDVESGLRSLGGAAGAIGAAPLAGALGGAGEFAATIEALPRLKAAAQGLPDVLNAAGASFGTSGAGFAAAVGLMGVALGAVQIAVGAFVQAMEAQAKQLGDAITAVTDVNRFIAQGGTEEEAQARIDELTAQRKADEQSLRELEQAYADSVGTAGILEPVLRATSAQEQELADQIDALKASTTGAEVEASRLQQAIDEGRLASEEAAEAEEKLAAERSAATINQAQAAGDLVRAQQQAADLTRVEAGERVQGLKDQSAAIQAQLRVLKSSGDTSEAVAGQIGQLETQLKSLGAQANVFDKVAKSTKPTMKELAELEEEKAREAEKAAKTSSKTIQSQKSGLDSLAKSAEDSRKKLADVEKKFAEDELALRQDLSDKRVDEQLNFRRELQQIDRNFDNQREDSLAEGNFLALSQTNKDEKRAQVEARIRNREQNEDITREGNRAHRDLLAQKQRQLQELASVERQFQQNSLNAAQTWGSFMTRAFSNFFQNTQRLMGGRQSLQNAPRTPG